MQQMSGGVERPAIQLVLGGQQQQVQQNDMFKKMMKNDVEENVQRRLIKP